jgi:S1-C subfamily serine protease
MEKANSVLFLIVTKAVHDFKHPYKSFKEKEVTGSGFIVDISRGLILTNAHVVSNAVSIVGRLSRLGKKDLSLEVIGICREKDLAICKIIDIDLITQGISNPNILNLNFADSLNVKPGDKVYTLGYHLGSSNIKITNGIISGFEKISKNSEEDREDSLTRSPTYIQISGAINPENSGGPLLNSSGKVIGINAAGYLYTQNIGYAIPSRTFLAIYHELIKSSNIKIPTLALNWCKTNREIMKKETGSSATYGIYVRKIFPDSCLDKLEKGDVIRRIDYVDFFQKPNGEINKSGFNLKELDNLLEKTLEKKENVVTVFIDRFGMSTKIGKLKNLYEKDENKFEFETIFTERKMELSEIMDMIPIGTELSLNMCRDKKWYLLKTKYIHIPSDRIPHIYPRMSPIDFEIFAGICVSNLDMKHFKIFDDLNSDHYKKQVIITHVFPGTSSYKTQTMKPGCLIKSILGFDSNLELIKDTQRIISSLDDVRHVLHLRPEQIQITTQEDFVFLVSLSTIIKEDKVLFETYDIKHKYILE